MTESDKQTAILAATLDLVAEQGFHGTPMSQVAKRSGVSAGIIYHYFENKDDLIHELHKHIKRKFSEALIHDEPHTKAYPENFMQLWFNAFNFYVSYPKETLFLEQYDNSPYAKEWNDTELDEYFQVLITMIETAINQGQIRRMSYIVLHDLSIGVALNLAKRQIAGQVSLSQAELEDVAEACIKAISTK
jgi:AcrR family transcriptional regulator